MIKLFNTEEQYTLPTGEELLGSELASRSSYYWLKKAPCVVDISGGILSSFQTLESFCDTYYVTFNEDDPEASLQKALEAKEQMQFDEEDTKFQQKMFNSMFSVAQITAMSFTDEQALEVKDIYPEYQVDHAYKQGEFFTHEGELYKVNQGHTSASQWEPGSVGTESLYTHLTLNEDGYPIWKQPTGAHDAYNKGDIVEYNGELYKSLIDGNAYSPDAYPAGWEKYTEPTE